MNTDKLEKIINNSFEQKEKINPKSDKKARKLGIEKLIQAAEQMVEKSGKKYMMSISRSNSLLKVHENLGWQVDKTPSHEMVKIL